MNTEKLISTLHMIHEMRAEKPIIPLEETLSEFRRVLLGFSESETLGAVTQWFKESTDMPEPEDIVYMIALRNGINPFKKMGVN